MFGCVEPSHGGCDRDHDGGGDPPAPFSAVGWGIGIVGIGGHIWVEEGSAKTEAAPDFAPLAPVDVSAASPAPTGQPPENSVHLPAPQPEEKPEEDMPQPAPNPVLLEEGMDIGAVQDEHGLPQALNIHGPRRAARREARERYEDVINPVASMGQNGLEFRREATQRLCAIVS